MRAQSLQDLLAIHPGHDEIEQDHVRPGVERTAELQGVRLTAVAVHGMAGGLENISLISTSSGSSSPRLGGMARAEREKDAA